jgi:hypothetical protein
VGTRLRQAAVMTRSRSRIQKVENDRDNSESKILSTTRSRKPATNKKGALASPLVGKTPTTQIRKRTLIQTECFSAR